MIWEIEPVTPFLIKSGNKFSLMDLYEEGNNLYRIDIDRFLQDLDKTKIDELNKIFEDFIQIKVSSERDKRYNRKNYDQYEKLWNALQKFYKVNNARMHKIFPPIEKDADFKRYLDFDQIMHIDVLKDNNIHEIPYIPGSTIKGFIRRMLMVENFKIRNSKNRTIRIGKGSEEWDKIEMEIKSLMRHIHVSDFYPKDDFKVKMMLVTRKPKSISISMPLIYSGNFYGEVNMININNRNENYLSRYGFNGSREDMEERLFKITTENSSTIIRKNREYYQNQLQIGPDDYSSLISIGFGKGLSLSGFASIKDDFNLDLPDIKSRAKGYGPNYVKQEFPKTNFVVSYFNGQAYTDNKIGILKLNKTKKYGYLKDIEELKYLPMEVRSR